MAKMVAKNLPVKLAALEGQFATEKGAPLRIGGIPDEGSGLTRYAIQIPYGLSILASGDPNATVKGLNDFPATERPPVAIVHLSFQIMVACGLAMMGIAVWAAWQYWRAPRKKSNAWVASRWFLRALILAAPLGFVALENGRGGTAVGRHRRLIFSVLGTA